MSTMPRVVIVGRMNVGKSTLFNRLAENAKSLTLDFAGVTRDFIKDTICWQNTCFELIDTGGINLRKSADEITEQVRVKALELIGSSNVVLFVCDGKVGVTPEDAEIARLLRKVDTNVFLIINKIDHKDTQEHLYEFDRLGFKTTIAISAQHATAIGSLLEQMVAQLPVHKMPEHEERLCRVALIGKPNVGKSSLMNALLKEERSIVTDQPGTTREAITEKIRFNRADIEVTDTAGIRRKRAVTETLETLMVKSSFRAVDEADIVLLLVDASEAKLADQELKLAFYILEQHKALIILFNKQDIVTDLDEQDMGRSLEEYEHLMKRVVPLNISCKTGKNIGKILPLIEKIWERYSQNFDNDVLTKFFKDALHRKPHYTNQNLLHVYRVKQVATAPITLVMFVNEPKWFGSSQISFFENLLRKEYDLLGVPIKFFIRKRG